MCFFLFFSTILFIHNSFKQTHHLNWFLGMRAVRSFCFHFCWKINIYLTNFNWREELPQRSVYFFHFTFYCYVNMDCECVCGWHPFRCIIEWSTSFSLDHVFHIFSASTFLLLLLLLPLLISISKENCLLRILNLAEKLLTFNESKQSSVFLL